MTAQAIRIDAHSLARDGVQRLCYAGPVVHANPAAALESRVPLKAGAEIFGAAEPTADAEVIALLLEVFETTGVADTVLVLGHMGIYLGMIAPLSLTAAEERELFAAVQSKSEADIAALLDDGPEAALLQRLPTLMGGRQVLDEAQALFAKGPPGVVEAVRALAALADQVQARCPSVVLRFDLAELAGYGYHNGPVFSAYQAHQGRALARGGRYDGIGEAFGRRRAATGFDVNLTQLVADAQPVPGIWAPWVAGSTSEAAQTLAQAVKALRASGERVMEALGDADAAPAECNRALRRVDGVWKVVARDT